MGVNIDFEKEVAASEQTGYESGTCSPRQMDEIQAEAGNPALSRLVVTELDRWIARKMLEVVGNPPIVLKLWDGAAVTPAIDIPVATLQYNTRSAMIKTILNPELYFGDLYSSGQVSFNGSLIKFMEIIYTNLEQCGRGSWLRKAVIWLGHRRIANTHDKAKDNIYHHYDIGNEFYRLWLDTDQMQYTCAYFSNPEMTLEQAQVAKLHHVCRKLQLEPGDSVVEAGCGWGGLGLFMAKHYGVRVTAYNISNEQVAYAHRRAEREGLSDRVEYILDDYRNISGKFDKFVSVGMLEHVGKGDFPALGRVIDNCLKPEGKGLIHTIGRNLPAPMNAWIERRIFPGAYPPSLQEMMQIFEPNSLSILDVENLRLHYSKTLQHWLQRYEQNSDQVQSMMDAEFVRAWRLYLAGSISAFNVGELQLFQVVFARAGNNQLPWSREHLYSPGQSSSEQASAEAEA